MFNAALRAAVEHYAWRTDTTTPDTATTDIGTADATTAAATTTDAATTDATAEAELVATLRSALAVAAEGLT